MYKTIIVYSFRILQTMNTLIYLWSLNFNEQCIGQAMLVIFVQWKLINITNVGHMKARLICRKQRWTQNESMTDFGHFLLLIRCIEQCWHRWLLCPLLINVERTEGQARCAELNDCTYSHSPSISGTWINHTNFTIFPSDIGYANYGCVLYPGK